MLTAQVEYVGFTTEGTARVYTLRARTGSDYRSFTLAIPSAAFATGRVRYQDAPEICFIKLRRELEAGADASDGARFDVSDTELDEYRAAHAPRPSPRRSKTPAATDAAPGAPGTPPLEP
jgi:hypothetical protein